jgi:hypothetical protein
MEQKYQSIFLWKDAESAVILKTNPSFKGWICHPKRYDKNDQLLLNRKDMGAGKKTLGFGDS